MNSSMNMVAGAFLGTCFVLMTLSIVSGAIYYSPTPEKEGFPIKAAEAGAAGTPQPKKEEIPPIAPLLATADIKKGEQVFKKCEACHDATKGGPNKIGPNLWGVVDRPIASHPGFSYSAALKKFSEDGKKHWTYELLNHWIHSPREVVSGTSMTFPGVKKDQERADVIAYLHSLADNPVPFPKPEAPKAEEGKAAPAADDKAAAPQDDETAPASDKATEEQPATDAGAQSGKTDAAGTAEQKPADQESGQPSEPAAK